MSFSDLERGFSSQTAPTRPNNAFDNLTSSLSLQVFKINANVTGITRLVDLLGTAKDTPSIRKKLTNLIEVTRELIKNSTEDFKALNAFQPPPRGQALTARNKLATEYKTSVDRFASIQKLALSKQKRVVTQQKADLEETNNNASGSGSLAVTPRSRDGQLLELEEQRPQQQQQIQLDVVPDSELEYQEQLIEEREDEIRGIEAGVHELNEIFRDLGTIVHEQQSMLDNIESNVINIANDTEGASSELTTAHEYQRKAGRRMFCLLMVFCLVLAIVLIAILA